MEEEVLDKTAVNGEIEMKRRNSVRSLKMTFEVPHHDTDDTITDTEDENHIKKYTEPETESKDVFQQSRRHRIMSRIRKIKLVPRLMLCIEKSKDDTKNIFFCDKYKIPCFDRKEKIPC